jgi:ABC-type sugar transport system permease subunit
MKIFTPWKSSRGMIGFLLVLPAFVYGILVYYIPIGIAFCNSFRTGPLNALKYAGLSNYVNVFNDRGFWEAVKNTAWFTLMAVVFIVVLSIVISIIINQVKKSNLSNSYIVLFLAPTVVSFVAAGLIWSWLMDSTYGLLNTVITWFGFKKLLFLNDPQLVLFWLSVIQTWVRLGFAVVIIFGGLKSISSEYYEAASIDGANNWNKHIRITIPLILPYIGVVSLLETINGSCVFGLINATTQGGPAGASRSIIMYLYDEAFVKFNFGTASACSVFLFVALLAFSIIQRRISRERV